MRAETPSSQAPRAPAAPPTYRQAHMSWRTDRATPRRLYLTKNDGYVDTARVVPERTLNYTSSYCHATPRTVTLSHMRSQGTQLYYTAPRPDASFVCSPTLPHAAMY